MNYFIYILYSPAFTKTYVGQTDNVPERLVKHNSGKVKSTKHYISWKLIYTESFNTRSEAMKREKWFKSPNGRKKITEILIQFHFDETNGLSISSHTL